MLRASTLVLAALFTAPSAWQAFHGSNVGIDAVIVRFLIAVPVAGVLLSLARLAMRPRPDEHNGTDKPR